MKGIIIRSPYIDEILEGTKKIEIRGMNTSIRGTVVLLKSTTNLALGTATITGVHEMTLDEYKTYHYNRGDKLLPINELPYKRTYAYELSNPVKFTKPKTYVHKKGQVIWVTLPDDFLD